MSLSVAVAGFGIGIIASDCRFSGEDKIRDDGYKLRRLADGWATITGSGPYPLMGLRILEDVGDALGALPPSEELGRLLTEGLFDRVPARTAEDAEKWGAIYTILRDGPPALELVDVVTRYGREPVVNVHDLPSIATSTPGRLEDLSGEIGDRLEWLVQDAGLDLTSLIRAVATLIREVYQVGGPSGTVSESMELGLSVAPDLIPGGRISYLKGSAREVSEASDDRIRSLLRPPPAPPAFPTPPEARMLGFAPAGNGNSRN